MRSQSLAGNILLASIERIRADRFVRMVRHFPEWGETFNRMRWICFHFHQAGVLWTAMIL